MEIMAGQSPKGWGYEGPGYKMVFRSGESGYGKAMSRRYESSPMFRLFVSTSGMCSQTISNLKHSHPLLHQYTHCAIMYSSAVPSCHVARGSFRLLTYRVFPNCFALLSVHFWVWLISRVHTHDAPQHTVFIHGVPECRATLTLHARVECVNLQLSSLNNVLNLGWIYSICRKGANQLFGATDRTGTTSFWDEPHALFRCCSDPGMCGNLSEHVEIFSIRTS